MHMDTSNWTLAERKRLQHMTEFHEEYQQVYGEKASICTIMKRRILNPPNPKSVCKEEMQNANLDTNEVIVEYITDAQGNKVKNLKPLLIKSEPDREYVHHIHSDDNLPTVPEDNFIQKREVTVYSYSETISSNLSSDDSTITLIEIVLPLQVLKKLLVKMEMNTKGIEATLHQIASGLQSTTEGYVILASHISGIAPYELPEVIAQIPPPPMDVPMPVRKALMVDGENKVVNYLRHGEYELNKTSWSKLQKKYNISKNKVYAALIGKGRPRGSQYCQKKRQLIKSEATISHSDIVND